MNSRPPADICRLALSLARESFQSDEVPVGCVICEISEDGAWQVISTGRNRILDKRDASAHAELSAISAACQKKKSERLVNCCLVTTLEPCLMCTGAIVLSRLEAVWYFAPVAKGIGLCEILEQARAERRLNHFPFVANLEEFRAESSDLLAEFFRRKRG